MSPGDIPPSFGRFQLLQVVRQDGATTLHDAIDSESGQKVALVTSPASADTAEEDRLAFRLPRMRHPNIVSVLDAGRQGDVAFVAAEMLETEPLSALLARAGRIPVFQGLALVLQLLSAIEHAQARRLVHATIDLEQVKVTPAAHLKLPAAGWSLSMDRQPNLEAAARIAQVLLSGPASPQMRSAVDAVLQRAQGPAPEARYQRADEFALALLAATGTPVWDRPGTMERLAAAEPEIAVPAPVAKSGATHVERNQRAPRIPLHRSHPGRSLLAVCLLAALLVPRLVGTGSSSSDAAAPAAPAVPTPVALAAVTPAPAAPAVVEAVAVVPASPMAPTPTEPVIEQPVVAVAPPSIAPQPAAVVPPSMAPQPVAPPLTEHPGTSAPASVAPHPAARTATRHAASVAPPRNAPRPVARTAVPQGTTVARAAPSAGEVQASKRTTTRVTRSQGVPVLTAAYGCPYDLPMPSVVCQSLQCARPELRRDPACARALAEQRAALARLRGTPD